MINWDDELGQRTLQRIYSEQVVWLTTVSPSGVPQPRPVWFVWDGATFLIYSTPQARKIAHIARNPNVALHFNTDAGGEDIQVILGIARVDANAPPSNLNAAYSEKYHAGILSLGIDESRYAEIFSAAVRITPSRLRGLEPIPGL
jgi:PPOX class probable F420-dependent enzyme